MSRWSLKQTEKMIGAAEECSIQFRKLDTAKGLIMGDEILVDHTEGDWLGTLVHELCHYLRGDANHREIGKFLKRWTREASWSEKVALMLSVF